MSVGQIINPRNVGAIKEVLTWTAPALVVPALRFQQDDRANRKELFLRDASTYTLGAALFLGTAFIGRHLLGKLSVFSPAVRDFTSFMVALTANLLYAGVGAVKLSKSFTSRQGELRVPALAPVPAATAPVVRPFIFESMKESQSHG